MYPKNKINDIPFDKEEYTEKVELLTLVKKYNAYITLKSEIEADESKYTEMLKSDESRIKCATERINNVIREIDISKLMVEKEECEHEIYKINKRIELENIISEYSVYCDDYIKNKTELDRLLTHKFEIENVYECPNCNCYPQHINNELVKYSNELSEDEIRKLIFRK